MSGILDVIELPADVATRITDVWITVTQAFGSGTTISVGDGDADDHFLLPTDVTVAGDQGVDLVHKGQKLNTNATALVKTKITLGIAATSVLSSMSAGAASVNILFDEVNSSDHNAAETTVGTSAGTVGAPSGTNLTGFTFSADDSSTMTVGIGDTITLTSPGGTAIDATTKTVTVTGSDQGFYISDGNVTESINNGETLIIAGQGTVNSAYNTTNNTLSITGDTQGFTISDGVVSGSVDNGGTLKIVGDNAGTAYNASTGILTIAPDALNVSTDVGGFATFTNLEFYGGAGFAVTSPAASDSGAGQSIEFNMADTAVVAGDYTRPAISIDAKGRITGAVSNLSLTQTIIQTTGGTGALSLDQDIDAYSPSNRKFHDVYEVDVRDLSGNDVLSTLRFPDPGNYAEGTTFTIKNVSYGAVAPSATGSTDIFREWRFIRITPHASTSTWTGSTILDGHYYHSAMGGAPGFYLPRMGAVTLARGTTGAIPTGYSVVQACWQIVSHYDPIGYASGAYSIVDAFANSGGPV